MPGFNQMFLDGCCDIIGSDDDGQRQPWRRDVPYARKTVGSKRFFEAEMAGHTITKMIRIPVLAIPLNCCEVCIGGFIHQVVQVQEIDDTFPHCLQLTLEQTGIAWAAQQN